MKKHLAVHDLPSDSIIMPVRNEIHYIRRSLEAMLAQDCPDELMKVIVADGMSDDSTRKVVQSFQRLFPIIRLIENLGLIVSTDLNAAIEQTKGVSIVRVDGHCEIAPNYVRRWVEHLQQDGVVGVVGPLETIGETTLVQVNTTAMSSTFGVGGSAFRTIKNRKILADTIAFPAYSRAVIEQVD